MNMISTAETYLSELSIRNKSLYKYWLHTMISKLYYQYFMRCNKILECWNSPVLVSVHLIDILFLSILINILKIVKHTALENNTHTTLLYFWHEIKYAPFLRNYSQTTCIEYRYFLLSSKARTKQVLQLVI